MSENQQEQQATETESPGIQVLDDSVTTSYYIQKNKS